MIEKLNLKDSIIAGKVLEIQQLSYSIEARLINFYDIPPLKAPPDSLYNCDELFYGYYSEAELAGIISYQLTNSFIDIYRLAIHPDYFRRAFADSLVDFVINNNKFAAKVQVSTGKENIPAVSLYLKKGFHKVRDIEIANRILLLNLKNN